jgi:hypothetical protein
MHRCQLRLFLLLLLWLPLGAIAQSRIQIVDSATGKGLPFASVASLEKKWGAATAEDGSLVLPDSIIRSALQVSFVGHRTELLRLKDNLVIPLAAMPMPEVIIMPCKQMKPVMLGKKRAGNSSVGWGSVFTGVLWGTYLPNKFGVNGRLTKLRFFIADRGDGARVDAPVRLRFFAPADSSGKPGIELTRDDIRIKPGRSGRIEVDLASYKIPVPAEGIIVLFELFESFGNYPYEVEHVLNRVKKKTICYGFSFETMSDSGSVGIWGSTYNNEFRVGSTAHPAIGVDMLICK